MVASKLAPMISTLFFYPLCGCDGYAIGLPRRYAFPTFTQKQLDRSSCIKARTTYAHTKAAVRRACSAGLQSKLKKVSEVTGASLLASVIFLTFFNHTAASITQPSNCINAGSLFLS